VLSWPLRILNVVIALVVVLIAIAVYWYAFRPLPKISGEMTAPIQAAGVIRRDARGVPHIEASNLDDTLFLQGFATAQDRLWQMDSLRRFGSGELAEVFGPAARPTDEKSRRMRMRAIAESNVQRLRPADRAEMVAYARGINFYIETHRGNYPLEFSLPGHQYDPRPWTLTDSMLIGLVMTRNLTDSSEFEFNKGTLLLQGADPARLRTIFPATQGGSLSPGSNAWAVNGAHTVTGKPITANDPHLAYGIPGTWHLVHLKAPGLNVSGAALPGVPGVITGHNEQIAWGVTNLEGDVMDLYEEQLDARTGRYIYQGKAEQAKLDREVIGVRGERPVELDVWVTRHGPVVAYGNGRSYSMRWSAAEGFGFPFLDIDRAQNWEQFRAALRSFWCPGQNFIYADRAGNIGYQGTGSFPIRRDFSGDVPLDGASGKFEWDGYIPFDQLPSVYNPASGIVATANQIPFPPGFPYTVTGSFADEYRIRQIRARLNAKPKLSLEDMLAIQKDVYSGFAHFLAREILAAATKHPSNDPLIREAVRVLTSWDGQMDKDKPAPYIAELLDEQLGASLTGSLTPTSETTRLKIRGQQPAAVPEKTGGLPKGAPAMTIKGPPPHILPRPQVIEHLLRQKPQGWVPNDDWDAWLIENLSSALAAGRAKQGSPVSKWKWGRALQWTLAHPIGKNLPVVAGYFDIGPVEMSGSGQTVKQTTATLGPSERMVVDLADLDRSVQNLVTGESGNIASAHYKDQWDAYYVGRSFPMQFNQVDAKDALRVNPER